MYSIVLFSMSTWREWKQGKTNRNKEVVEELRRRDDVDKVLLVDFMPHTLKRAARFALMEHPFYRRSLRPMSDVCHGLYRIRKNFYLYSPTTSALVSFGEHMVYRNINKIQKKLGFKNTLTWSYTPLFVDYFKEIHSIRCIFDCVDNWSVHSVFRRYRSRLEKNYSNIDKRSDIIFTVSSDLFSLFPDNKYVYHIPNGVRMYHDQQFQAPRVSKETITIGYVGIIQDRIDGQILKAILKHPQYHLMMYGPVWKNFNVKKYKQYSNITFSNKTHAHKLIPSLIANCDVMIIPHKTNKFTRSMNPMKLYDYLSCGKPVVSTPIHDLSSDIQPFVEIATEPSEFSRLIQKSFRENTPQKQKKRIEIMKNHSWEKKVNDMMSLIYDLTPQKENTKIKQYD